MLPTHWHVTSILAQPDGRIHKFSDRGQHSEADAHHDGACRGEPDTTQRRRHSDDCVDASGDVLRLRNARDGDVLRLEFFASEVFAKKETDAHNSVSED